MNAAVTHLTGNFELDVLGMLHRCSHCDLIWSVEMLNNNRTPIPPICGTQTQVLADSITIAVSALNHCTT